MSNSKLSGWVGRTQNSIDQLNVGLIKRIAGTLGAAAPNDGEALPLLWYWAFFQDPVFESGLGPDGHPARGGFLPEAGDRNRMWAGSRIEFFEPLTVGSIVKRISTILDVQEKQGRNGSLLFVTVCHEYIQGNEVALREEQDIVYREPTPPKLSSDEAVPVGGWKESVDPSPTLLFRYSAVTFNGHRIHYDWPYATTDEGYPGLVVHGPLIATLVLQGFCRANPQLRPRRFAFRGMRPLICPDRFEIGGQLVSSNKASVWAGNQAGLAQVGEVEFA